MLENKVGERYGNKSQQALDMLIIQGIGFVTIMRASKMNTRYYRVILMRLSRLISLGAGMLIIIATAQAANFATVMQGGRLYAKNCAQCHGATAQGAPNWHKVDKLGKYPPPPLNGTGHAWHHGIDVLKGTIRNGGKKLGGTMPGFASKLSDKDMEAIIAWFQSHWPKKIMDTWERNNNKRIN